MRDTDLFDATIHNGIAMGSCVMIQDSEIVYAGPLHDVLRPDACGKVIFTRIPRILRC